MPLPLAAHAAAVVTRRLLLRLPPYPNTPSSILLPPTIFPLSPSARRHAHQFLLLQPVSSVRGERFAGLDVDMSTASWPHVHLRRPLCGARDPPLVLVAPTSPFVAPSEISQCGRMILAVAEGSTSPSSSPCTLFITHTRRRRRRGVHWRSRGASRGGAHPHQPHVVTVQYLSSQARSHRVVAGDIVSQL